MRSEVRAPSGVCRARSTDHTPAPYSERSLARGLSACFAPRALLHAHARHAGLSDALGVHGNRIHAGRSKKSPLWRFLTLSLVKNSAKLLKSLFSPHGGR